MSEITHQAIISDIKKDNIILEMIRTEACKSCALKGICEEKRQISAKPSQNTKYNIGEKVNVYISEKQAFIAIFFGYILPLLLVLTILCLCLYFFNSETIAALASLSVLPFYYTVLHFFEKNFKKT
ncbi:MAG: SoxR reducing system RseC family protein, partial [Alphaproteobacteria bacterium]|nr:SoxR reducing system RseC family protein [Alphaproteobacteria bacterium]